MDRHERGDLSRTKREDAILTPVATWLVIQMVPLLLCATQVRLWARVTQPVENFSLHFMLAAQFAGSAMLFPWLMRNWRASAVVIFCTAPFCQLAGMLSEQPVDQVVQGIAMIWLWLFALALWRVNIRTQHAQAVGVAIASTLAVGGCCVCYLAMDFADSDLRLGIAGVYAVLTMNLLFALVITALFHRARAKLSTDNSQVVHI